MSSEKSRKSFLIAIASVVGAVIALPKLLTRNKSAASVGRPASAFQLRQDPRTVKREDSRFA